MTPWILFSLQGYSPYHVNCSVFRTSLNQGLQWRTISGLLSTPEQHDHIDSPFHTRSHIEEYLIAQYRESSDLKKPPHTLIHTYKPLIVCRDGGAASQTGTLPSSIIVTVSYRVISFSWTGPHKTGILPSDPHRRLCFIQNNRLWLPGELCWLQKVKHKSVCQWDVF